jgi:DNA-binding transcriptional MerR regulator
METTQSMWTIEELTRVAERVLRQDYWGQPSGQAAELPNLRTVRYYTTLGLLDRPVMRGRVAYYTRRHLAQLVAIKRLQAEGLTLAEVQQRLYGLPDDALERIARLPESLETLDAPTPPAPTRRRRRFWTEPPAPPTAPENPRANLAGHPPRAWRRTEPAVARTVGRGRSGATPARGATSPARP